MRCSVTLYVTYVDDSDFQCNLPQKLSMDGNDHSECDLRSSDFSSTKEIRDHLLNDPISFPSLQLRKRIKGIPQGLNDMGHKITQASRNVHGNIRRRYQGIRNTLLHPIGGETMANRHQKEKNEVTS